MQPIHLAWVDYAILLSYTCFVIGIGFALRRYMKTSSDFFLSGRSIPAWVTGLARGVWAGSAKGTAKRRDAAASGSAERITWCTCLC